MRHQGIGLSSTPPHPSTATPAGLPALGGVEVVADEDDADDLEDAPVPEAESGTATPKSVESGSSFVVLDPEEVSLLDRCRESLRGGDAAAAARAMELYREKFPLGALAEEADALRIEAFWKSGRAGEANASFAAFRETYPDSPLRARLEEVVNRPPPAATSSVRRFEDPFESRY